MRPNGSQHQDIDSAGYVLIIGGAGFIGTRLAGLLSRESVPFTIADVKKPSVYPERWKACDVRQLEQVLAQLRGASAIINLAAEHRDDVHPITLYREVNVDGAKQVCEAARRSGVKKIIFTSSVAVYGFHSHAVDESGPFEPFNEYGKTKLEAEGVYRAWQAEDSERSLVIIRPTVVFGEGNRGNVFNLLHQIANGKFRMVGSGENVKSMAYVGNVAQFIVHTLSLGPGVHVSNYVDAPDMNTQQLVAHIYGWLSREGTPKRVPLWVALAGGQVLDAIARLTGRRFSVSAIRVRKFTETTQFKADLVTAWGFQPTYSLSEGLTRTLEHEFGAQRGK